MPSLEGRARLRVCTFCLYNGVVGFEWNPTKAEANYRKHGVRFGEAQHVLSDDHALTTVDNESDPDEERFVTLGMGNKGRLLVVVYTYRADNIRIVSARVAERHEAQEYGDRL
ncbi:MAG: BrnT family toxin [Acidobacteriaceae bacterium]|nr:BrnT family toxin [Acidobacteriaceae bacterium]